MAAIPNKYPRAEPSPTGNVISVANSNTAGMAAKVFD